MSASLIDQTREAGVVGAGGGGFPTHVKLGAEAEYVIANGAECEPLLHKDAAVMEQNAADLVRGLLLAAEAAVKAADVTLMGIRLAMALGGKAFASFTGDVSSVQAAVDADKAVISEAGVLVNAVVIPRPHERVYHEVL